MPQVLQTWSPVAVFNGAAPAAHIRNTVADANGGFTAFWDQRTQAFTDPQSSRGFSAFGTAIGSYANGSFWTGFVEWGGGPEEIIRTASHYIYINDEYRIIGLSPGFPILGGFLSHASLAPVSGTVLGVGSVTLSSTIEPEWADLTSDSVLTVAGRVATVITAESVGYVGGIAPPSPPVPASTTMTLQAADGSLIGIVTLSTDTVDDKSGAAVAGLGSGSIIGIWSEDNADGSGSGIMGQRVNEATLGLIGTNVLINVQTAGNQDQSVAARMADGNVAVVWRDASGAGGDASGTSIKLRIIRPDGTFATGEMLVNVTTAGNQFMPQVVALNTNQVLVLWVDASTGVNQLRGIVIGNTGAAVTGELLLATGASVGAVEDLYATTLQDGRVVVTWFNATANSSFSTIVDPRPDVIFGTSANETFVGRDIGMALSDETIVAGAGDDTIWGLGGVDRLHGGLGRDRIYGGNGDDFLYGNEDDDTIYGETYSTETGNDTIYGGTGRDTIFGMAGNDTIYGQEDRDTIVGGTGNDTIYGGDNVDSLHGDAGTDTIFGGNGNDFLWGGEDNDTLYGDAGIDVLQGGNGADTLFGQADGDALYGNAGIDTILGGEGADFLYGGTETDYLYGENGIDTLFGGDAADFLYGGADSDVLRAEEGDDRLFGGTGNDYIYTGSGADLIYIQTGSGVDQVFDFTNGVDRFVFQVPGVSSFADLAITYTPGYALVSFAGGTLYLYAVIAGQLDATDFIF